MSHMRWTAIETVHLTRHTYGVLECDIVMLQNYMLMIPNKRFYNKKEYHLCQTPCTETGCGIADLYYKLSLVGDLLKVV